jgi:hypothetical protein
VEDEAGELSVEALGGLLQEALAEELLFPEDQQILAALAPSRVVGFLAEEQYAEEAEVALMVGVESLGGHVEEVRAVVVLVEARLFQEAVVTYQKEYLVEERLVDLVQVLLQAHYPREDLLGLS